MASAASIAGTRPRVSIMPRAMPGMSLSLPLFAICSASSVCELRSGVTGWEWTGSVAPSLLAPVVDDAADGQVGGDAVITAGMAGRRGADGDDEIARPCADRVERHLQLPAVVLDHPERLALERGGSTGGDEVAHDALDVHRRAPPLGDG